MITRTFTNILFVFLSFLYLPDLSAQVLQKYFNSSSSDVAHWVAPTEASGYTFCGRQGTNALLAEVDSTGTLLFDKVFSGSGTVEFRKNVSTSSGVFAAGVNKSTSKAFCVFTDHSGNIQRVV